MKNFHMFYNIIQKHLLILQRFTEVTTFLQGNRT